MKTKTINLYQFHELTEEQKAQVIERYRDINDDTFDCMVRDEFITLPLFEAGFLDPEIHYSLSYCQGDGACFDCNDFEIHSPYDDGQAQELIMNVYIDSYEIGD